MFFLEQPASIFCFWQDEMPKVFQCARFGWGELLFLFFLSYMSLVFTYHTDQPESQIQTKVLQQKQKKFVSTTRKTSLSCYHGTFQRAATSASLFLPCLLRKVPVLTEAFECHCNICLLLRMKGIRKNVIVIKLPDIQLQTTTAFK